MKIMDLREDIMDKLLSDVDGGLSMRYTVPLA